MTESTLKSSPKVAHWLGDFVYPECKHFGQAISWFCQQIATHALDFIAPKAAYLHQLFEPAMQFHVARQSCMMLNTSEH